MGIGRSRQFYGDCKVRKPLRLLSGESSGPYFFMNHGNPNGPFNDQQIKSIAVMLTIMVLITGWILTHFNPISIFFK